MHRDTHRHRVEASHAGELNRVLYTKFPYLASDRGGNRNECSHAHADFYGPAFLASAQTLDGNRDQRCYNVCNNLCLSLAFRLVTQKINSQFPVSRGRRKPSVIFFLIFRVQQCLICTGSQPASLRAKVREGARTARSSTLG